MRFSIGLLKGFLKDVHMGSTIKAWQGLATSYLNKCSFFSEGGGDIGKLPGDVFHSSDLYGRSPGSASVFVAFKLYSHGFVPLGSAGA